MMGVGDESGNEMGDRGGDGEGGKSVWEGGNGG